jgi:hypothetical protein
MTTSDPVLEAWEAKEGEHARFFWRIRAGAPQYGFTPDPVVPWLRA